ncbi:MAG: beta-galactosidase [Clostridium sp.]|nr:beta-galactosidase [Clostridium sp.]
MNIKIKEKQILIDGKPQIIMCGEIHYYRLERNDWEDRIIKLKNSGCNAVATYIPWICHEPIEGEIDVEGKTKDILDIGAFIDLCNTHGLMCFMRPGPFIMAEMKNEGIPHWVAKKYPELIPKTWDNKTAPNPTLDYLSPNFLREVKRWYSAIMPIIAKRLCTNGGNVIGIQLDNEIGMLSWVSNSPDLTDFLLVEFTKWLKKKYKEDLSNRYPIDFNDFESIKNGIRSPKEEYSLKLLKDLGYYMRYRFAEYIRILRGYAEEYGIKGVPFAVNIHGTGGGRGFTYPIGISQLYEAYTQDDGYISGSDIYLGSLTMDNFQDLYIINGMMDAVHNNDQPLTSLEFECGDGNYGSTFGGRYDVSAADFKTRMCIAQGNRMLNYYLFVGGKNYRMDLDLKDGNDRIASTGERHGFAAPIGPEGQLNYTYERMSKSIKTMLANSDKIAAMNEEYDNLVYGFIPDYFMTEYHYPNSNRMKDMIANITQHRAYWNWEVFIRGILLLNYRFTAVDLQNKDINENQTLVIPSALYMPVESQEKIKIHLENGGRVLLYGEVPKYDMEGNECTILADALGIIETSREDAGQHYYLSVYTENFANNSPEVRVGYAQTFKINNGIPILRVYGTNSICGFETTVGKGNAIVIATNYSCDLDFINKCLERLKTFRNLKNDCEHHGLFMTTTTNKNGERYIHMLNLDGFDKKFNVYLNEENLFGGKEIELFGKDGVMLPIDVNFGEIKIKYSTAEIIGVEEKKLIFRLTQSKDEIVLQTKLDIYESDDFIVEEKDNFKIIHSLKHSKVDEVLEVRFKNLKL